MSKKKKKTTKSKKEDYKDRSLFPKSPYLYAEEQKRKSKRKKEDPPIYHFKHKRRKENQMDRDDPEGINVKKGGLILRVTNRGPLYKGKKSGKKIS